MNVLNDDTKPDWEHLAPILDEAMNRLAAPERDAIVLRYFERRDLHGVGAALGVSEEAAGNQAPSELGVWNVYLFIRFVQPIRSVVCRPSSCAGLVSDHHR